MSPTICVNIVIRQCIQGVVNKFPDFVNNKNNKSSSLQNFIIYFRNNFPLTLHNDSNVASTIQNDFGNALMLTRLAPRQRFH